MHGLQESRFSAVSDKREESGSQESPYSTLYPPEEGGTEKGKGNATSDGPTPATSPVLMPNIWCAT